MQFAILLVGAIDIADIATAEDVAVIVALLVGAEFSVAYLATTDIDTGLSEDITIGI